MPLGASQWPTHLMPNLAQGIAKQGAHHVKLKGAELADLLIARVLREEGGSVDVLENSGEKSAPRLEAARETLLLRTE